MSEPTETGNLHMPLQWVKSNWTILSVLAVMAYGGYKSVTDMQYTQVTQGHDINEIRKTIDDRAALAEKRYAESVAEDKAENIPMRVRVLEQQQAEMREMFRQFQAGQVAQFEALKEGFSDIKSEVRVVSSKVDDLREQRPQKTLFTK